MPCSLKELGVVVGYKCNFKCAHCCTGHNRSEELSSSEKLAVISAINRYSPRSLLFVGGETTLYRDMVNEIMSAVSDLPGRKVKITTNGYFAKSKKEAVKMLSSFDKLTGIQLSYDRFHAEFLPIENVGHLFAACKDLGLGFCVINTISSPMDLVGLKRLKSIGDFRIVLNKVFASGEAARNGIEYPYPSFDGGVLGKRCPSRHKMAYICGRGFSICCSNLTFDTNLPAAHRTVGAHLRSRIYRLLAENTFAQLLDKAGLKDAVFPPGFSLECVLCEHIFTKGKLI